MKAVEQIEIDGMSATKVSISINKGIEAIISNKGAVYKSRNAM